MCHCFRPRAVRLRSDLSANGHPAPVRAPFEPAASLPQNPLPGVSWREIRLPKHLALLLLLLTAQHSPAQADAIDDIVDAEMKRQHSPAIGVAVVRNGAAVKVRGYGLANLEHRVPATAATFFQTASVGKAFTAALVLLLVREGTIQLDAPVSSYLPDAPPAWEGVTVRRLLNHTSGLVRTDPAIDLGKDYSEAELLASAYRLPLLAPPGQRHVYSNLGYQVLGILCSRVGGRFWGEQMREKLFAPLRMTARVISEQDIVPGRAAGYLRWDGHFENQRWVAPSQNTTADGSLYVSARDMARWADALQGQQLLNAAEKESLWQATLLSDGQLADYGLGWALFSVAGHRQVRHRGDWQGFTTHILHLPEDRLTISVLMNRANAQPHVIADRIAAHFIPGLRKPVAVAPTPAAMQRQALYLRGTFNDWKPTLHLEALEPGLLRAQARLDAGMQAFKIGDVDWKLVDLGARFDEALAKPGKPQRLEFQGEDLFLEVDRAGEYRFVLDLRGQGAPKLTVQAVP